MHIHKILNNNVVVALDKQSNELVVMGRGIGFKKKQGDHIENILIERKFLLNNKETFPRFAEILSEMPLEVITTSEIIIDYAKSILEGKLHDNIYISLTDHINFAVERHKQGLDIPNSFLWEIKKLYPKEFQISLHSLTIIKQRLNIQLPEDEAGFITFHIINAQLNDTLPNIANVTKIMREILNIVKYQFNLNYDEDSIPYQRFITHLKFFAQRVLNNNFVTSQDTSLYEIVKKKYIQSYKGTSKINQYLTQKYQHPLTDEEKLFLTIHIERLRSEQLQQD